MSGSVTLKPKMLIHNNNHQNHNLLQPTSQSQSFQIQNTLNGNRQQSMGNYNPISERMLYQQQQNRMNSSYTIDQKYRDSSIYNRNLSIQIMKEQAFKNREIELRKKYEGMDLDKLKELLPNISNRSTYNIEEVYTRPLSPTALNKQTYLEIFNSRKESMRKHLNYINYTNQNYNVLSNNIIGNEGDAYQQYLTKRLDYESQVPQYREAQTNNFFPTHNHVIAQRILDVGKFDMINQDRKQMRLQMKSHILKNIKKAKDQKHTLAQSSVAMGVSSNGFASLNRSKLSNYQNNANTQRQSPDQGGDIRKVQNKPNFNARNFYKYLEQSKAKSVINTRPSSNQYQRLENHSVLLKNKNVNNDRQSDTLSQFNPKMQLKDTSNQINDDLITVVGKQNSIKQNAYTDQNIEDLDQNTKTNKKHMKRLAQQRQFMNSQASKFRLNTKNLHELSRQHNMSLNNSKSARDVQDQKQSRLDNNNHHQQHLSVSEYSNNQSVAFSKRWQNLETYIQAKKSKKLKDQALSHATSIAEKSDYQSVNHDETRSILKTQQKFYKQYRARSVAEPLEVIQDEKLLKDNSQTYINNNVDSAESSSEISIGDLDPFHDDDDIDDINNNDKKYDIESDLIENEVEHINSKQTKQYRQKVKKLKERLRDEQRKRENLEKLIVKIKDI